MNLQKILGAVARAVRHGEPGRILRSGDLEVHIQEKPSGDRQVVVLYRQASIDLDEFQEDVDE